MIARAGADAQCVCVCVCRQAECSHHGSSDMGVYSSTIQTSARTVQHHPYKQISVRNDFIAPTPHDSVVALMDTFEPIRNFIDLSP